LWVGVSVLRRRAALFHGVTMDDRNARDDGEPARLIEAIARAQDRAAFTALFQLYAPRIKSFLMRTGTSAETAEELAQEAMLTVWRKAGYFDGSRAASAWIFAIARNLRIDRVRRDRRAQAHAIYDVLDQDEPELPDRLLADAERDHRVRAALEVLSRDQLTVVELSFFQGRAHGEIARVLGIPLGTVKSRLRLALGRLRELLGDLT
jgi:RNA polymerase sigma-70 factor (ECF subfamily)